MMKFDVCIVGGLGRVGLPLGIFMAEKGLNVALYDKDEARRTQVRCGIMPFMENGADSALKKNIGKGLFISQDISDVGAADHIMITIGTPIDEYLNPRLLPIFTLCEEILPFLRIGHSIILRSTVFPGTSQKISEWFDSKGKKVSVSFCPERILQGQALEELPKLPQIVSGVNEEALKECQRLFKLVGINTISLSTIEAELAKLFSNSWRYIQFATANQLYQIAEDHGADFYAIRAAMMENYPRMREFPGAGFAAGPCLLKDTMQLSAFSGSFSMGDDARIINEGMPNFILEKLRKHSPILGKKIGILGMSFKSDNDDTRDSLSYKLGKLLRFDGAKVYYSDEFVKDPTFVSVETILQQCDMIVIATPHSAYKGLVIPSRIHVEDLWGCL